MPNSLDTDLRASLKACGMGPRQSVMISKFVSQCIGLVHAAHDHLTQPVTWTDFLQKRGALSKTKGGPPRVKETAVSADIALHAQGLLKKRVKVKPSLAPTGFVAADAISYVQADALMPSSAATGNSSKRPDLFFAPADAELNLTFAIEAKVLENQHDCRDVLLGPEGLGCFTRALDPYETKGVIGLFGYAEQSSAGQQRTFLQTALVGGAMPGSVTVNSALRTCSWDGTAKDRESILAHPAPSNLVCLGVVLDFPSIRQPAATSANKSAAAKTRSGASRKKVPQLTSKSAAKGVKSASGSVRSKP